MEERQRVKIVDYIGSKKVETLQDRREAEGRATRRSASTRSSIPAWSARSKASSATCCGRRASSSPTVTHEIKEIPGGPKLVHITFNMDEGPKVKIRKIEFVGNKAISDGTLKRQHEGEQGAGPFTDFIHSRPGSSHRRRGTYQETEVRRGRREGRSTTTATTATSARSVGEPELKDARRLDGQEDALGRAAHPDHRRAALQGRQLRRRRQHGRQDRVPEAAVQDEAGEYYSEKRIRKGLEKAREIYGAGGYYGVHRLSPTTSSATTRTRTSPRRPTRSRRPRRRSRRTPRRSSTSRCGCRKGKQFFVNRITFTGNTTTRDNVIRREMRLVENGVFNTEALKYSVKRLNQLGYFKALEGKPGDVDVEKTPNDDEQGRRQAEARGAEPQPADLRRRRVGVRGLLRPAVVPDRELPRPRREPDAVAAGRLARAELLAGVHRAVPVRSQHHRRRRTSSSSRRPLHRPVHAEVDRRRR